MTATAMARERIHWPEYVACVLTLAHHADPVTHVRDGRLVCIDCRINLARARTRRWRLFEWALFAAVALAVGGPLALSAWWLR